jgi:phage terminase small subunit
MDENEIDNDDVIPKWAVGLSHRQRRFVEEYLVDLNGRNAILRIGRSNPDADPEYSSDLSARNAALQMKRNPKVCRAIEIALNEFGVTKLWIIEELVKLARADLSQFGCIEEGRVKWKDHAEIDPELLPLMSEMSETITEFGTTITIKLLNDRPALMKLAKLLGMERQKLEISGPDGGAVQVESPRAILMERLAGMKRNSETGG